MIGVALSADAMSVTVCNLLANPQLSRRSALAMPMLFGLFQGAMPLAGYFAGSLAASFIARYAGILTMVILGVIGAKMVHDGLAGKSEGQTNLGLAAIALQAVATSIDAFAVGVSFVAGTDNIFVNAGVIAACTFVLCLAMLAIGRRFGAVLGSHAQVLGGVVLILIGVKALLGI